MSTNISSTEQIVEINAGDQITNVNVVSQSTTQVISGEQVVVIDTNAGTIPAAWGSITGTLSNQTDLKNALDLKQNNITLTTTGTSGVATLVGSTLNIPNYADTGLTSVGLAMPTAFTVSGSPLTSNGTITVTGAGTGAQYIKGDGTLATFPTTINQSLTLIREVYNSTGATLTKGTVVYINGGQGNLPTVTKAIATGDATSAQTFGIVQSNITNNNNGYVVIAGGINDLDTQAYPDGTALYLSPTTAGAFTSTKPYAPQHMVYLGVVVRSHPTQGVIEVKIQNGYELSELHDVSARFPVNHDGLFYNSTSGVWENKSISGVLGYTPVPQSRIITINGTAQDLSADRTYNVGTVTSVAASGGTGISISGSPITGSGTITVTNTAPDQIVSLSGAGTTSISGTYPNFTITSNDEFDGTVTSVAASGGTGISISGSPITSSGTLTITNTAPDQVVSLTGTGTTTTSGTYPNFTINSADQYTGTVTSVAASAGTGISISGSPVTGSGTITVTNTAPDQIVSITAGGLAEVSGTYPNFTVSVNDAYGGSVTSVNASVPTGFDVSGVPITAAGTIDIKFATGYSLPTNTRQSQWDDAYTKRIDNLTVTGSSGASTLVGNVLNIPQYQASGNYFTGLTGEATSTGYNPATVTLTNSAVIGKVLTGLNITGGSIADTDSILSAFGKVQNQINGLIGGSIFQSTWNASTNTPTLTSSIGTKGYYYIVSTAGTTNLDGITDWQIGDWAIFDGTVWRKVDNTDAVVSVNGYTGIVSLTTSDITEGTRLYYTDTRARQAISLTTTGSSGASTYNNTTGVLNVPQYTLTGLGGFANPMTTLGDIMYGGISGTATRLAGNTTTGKQYLSQTGDGTNSAAPSWSSIAGSDITGAALTKTDDTNVTLTLGGTPSTALLRAASLTLGWTGQLSVARGGTGAATLTGVLIGNGTSAVTAVTGTSGQLLRRNSGDTAYEFFTPSYEPTLTKGNLTEATSSVLTISGGTGAVIGSGTTIQVKQASSTVSGYLSSTDWSTFNNKQATITLTTTGTSGAATFSSNTLNIPQYQAALTNPVTGTGTTNYLPIWTSSSAIGSSSMYYSEGTNSNEYTFGSIGAGNKYNNSNFNIYSNSNVNLYLQFGSNKYANIYNLYGDVGISVANSGVHSTFDIIYFNGTGTRYVALNSENGEAFRVNSDRSLRFTNYSSNGFVKTSSSNGTITIDTTSYLPLTGGTLTGALIGTTFATSANSYYQLGYGSDAASRSWQIKNDELDPGDLNFLQSTTRTGSTYSTKLRIKANGTLVAGVLEASTTTLTGALSGTSATFSGGDDKPLVLASTNASNLVTEYKYNTSTTIAYIGNETGLTGSGSSGNFGIRAQNGFFISTGGATARLTIASTGAATFSNYVTIGNSSTTPSILTLYPSASAKGWQITANNYIGSALEFTPATANGGTTFTTPAMLITSGGNVGIGTSSPNTILDVNTGISTSSGTAIMISQNTTGAVKPGASFGLSIQNGGEATNAADLWIRTASGGTLTERMRITSGGIAVIGNNPTVSAGLAAGGLHVSDRIAIASGSVGTPSLHYATDTNTGIYFPAADTLGLVTGGAERMRITSGGDVEVNGTVSKLTLASDGVQMIFGRNGTNYIQANGGTSAEIRVISNTNGVVLANGGTSWGSLSDINSKDIIEPIENACYNLSQLRTIIGKYKTDDENKRRLFLIAQDIEKVYPEAVFKIKSENNEESLGLNYQDLIPVLVKAIQELKSELDILKNKN